MVIESLGLYYHIECFRCCVCNIPLSSSLEGTDVRVRSNRLHCQNCFSDENGKKTSFIFFILSLIHEKLSIRNYFLRSLESKRKEKNLPFFFLFCISFNALTQAIYNSLIHAIPLCRDKPKKIPIVNIFCFLSGYFLLVSSSLCYLDEVRNNNLLYKNFRLLLCMFELIILLTKSCFFIE